ncbi:MULTISPECIES: pirin family protein [Chryseobacterium]|uniref:Pirin family protein n=1 Tax=Chryseobacterium wanjuense TaxID=356305 RepID=A0A1I0R046_9FLAO|nr:MULTISPECIES: pirin-like C-terminal cupin domain-containing protein [Chryseobacterium]KYH08251.1 hypothetical protein A1704_06240 [Chryseobacterium cucumeris]SEW33417.1 hypothetical protein SAMN05421841_2402 [Chryseobacterium wanjuense]
MIERLIRKTTESKWRQGFLGMGHKASAILEKVSYKESDPFILFMDDKLNLPGTEPVGGPHPHAGFEILTLVLKGNEKDWLTGSFELLTAGSGIIHSEEIKSQQDLRILQVWLALPAEKRWVEPFWQRILLENVPTLKNENFEIRVYSGSSNGLISPITSITPFILVDFRVKVKQTLTQMLPSNYNGLVYVLEGSIQIGNKIIEAGQVGWFNRTEDIGDSVIEFKSINDDTHFILYAGMPHNEEVIAHGPFIADVTDDIYSLYEKYRDGKMPHVDNLSDNKKVNR